MSIAAGLAGLLALWFLGAMALAVAGLRPRGADAVAAEFATGALIVAAGGTLAVVSRFHLDLAPFYVLLVGLVTAAGWRRRWLHYSFGLPRDPVAAAALALAAAILLAFFTSSIQDRLWWDGWAIWAFKARVLFLDGTLPDRLLDPAFGYGYTDPDYPLALPLVTWWIYSHAGEAGGAFASVTGAVLHALVVLLAWGALRDRVGHRIAAGAALGIAAFWPLAFYASGGTADVLLALALLGGVVELERGFGRGDSTAFWRAAIYLSLGGLAKNEGLALAAAALVVGAVGLVRARGRGVHRLAPLALPALVIAPWWLFVRAVGLRVQVGEQVEAFLATAGAAAGPGPLDIVGRNAGLLASALGDLFASVAWLPALLLAVVGAAAALRRRHPGNWAPWLLLGLQFSAVCAAYLLLRGGLEWLLVTSLKRVVAVFVPATACLALLAALGPPGPEPGGASRPGHRETAREPAV